MNPFTGSVDTEENWLAEMPTWDEDPEECKRQFDTLVEVVKTKMATGSRHKHLRSGSGLLRGGCRRVVQHVSTQEP